MKTKPTRIIHFLLLTLLAPQVSAQITGVVPGPNVGDFVDIPALLAAGPFGLLPGATRALMVDQGKLKIVDLETKKQKLWKAHLWLV